MLSKLRLHHFRNFETAEFDLSAVVSVFTGKNGTGKSSVLEAIYLFSTLRSFRTFSLSELKKIGTPGYMAELDLSLRGGWDTTLRITDMEVRSLYMDGKQIRKASQFAGCFKTVAFLPDDSDLITEGPAYRRRFLDRFLCMTDPVYYTSIQQYQTALKHYNMLLKKNVPDQRAYTAYASILAEEAAVILPKREKAVQDLSAKTSEILKEMRPELSGFQMDYHFDPKLMEKDFFLSKLESNFERNRLRGSLNIGPHHDELDIAVSGKVLRNYGSRGQCRISALSMKLAELELISEQFGSFTVIVDDAFSDLDIPAKEAFLRRVSKAEQIYYAFTELPVEKEFEGANIITLGENA